MPLFRLGEKQPQLADNTWVAPNATVIGDVRLGTNASASARPTTCWALRWWSASDLPLNPSTTGGQVHNLSALSHGDRHHGHLQLA